MLVAILHSLQVILLKLAAVLRVMREMAGEDLVVTAIQVIREIAPEVLVLAVVVVAVATTLVAVVNYGLARVAVWVH
jgi:hypothetical protein